VLGRANMKHGRLVVVVVDAGRFGEAVTKQ
jgi:hypothetical protein